MDLKETPEISFHEPDRHPWEIARVKVVQSLIKHSLSGFNLNSKVTIIDIGCGDAFLLYKISQNYIDPFPLGVDNALTKRQIEILKSRYPLPSLSFYNTIEELTQTTIIQSDIVLLLDVLEHIEEDSSFLQQLANQPWITEKTIILITVPAFQMLFSNHDSFLGHCRRYSNNSLKNTITANGFTIEKIGYFFSSLLFVRILLKCIEIVLPHKFNNQKGAGAWKGSKLISKIIVLFLWLDFLIINSLRKIGIKVPGLSNYAICRKSV